MCERDVTRTWATGTENRGSLSAARTDVRACSAGLVAVDWSAASPGELAEGGGLSDRSGAVHCASSMVGDGAAGAYLGKDREWRDGRAWRQQKCRRKQRIRSMTAKNIHNACEVRGPVKVRGIDVGTSK